MNEETALISKQKVSESLLQDNRVQSDIFDDKLMNTDLDAGKNSSQYQDDNTLSINDIKRQINQKLAQTYNSKWQNVKIKTYFWRNIVPLLLFFVISLVFIICYFLLCGLSVLSHTVAYGPTNKIVTFFWNMLYDDNETFSIFNQTMQDIIQIYNNTVPNNATQMIDSQFPYQILINSSYIGLNVMEQLNISQNISSSKIVIKTYDPARRYVSIITPWFGLTHWQNETIQQAPANVVHNITNNQTVIAFCYPPQNALFKAQLNYEQSNIYSENDKTSHLSNNERAYIPRNSNTNGSYKADPLGPTPYYYQPNNVPIWVINLNQLAYGRCGNKYCNKNYQLSITLPSYKMNTDDIYSCIAPFVFRDLLSKITINVNNIEQFEGDIWLDLIEGSGTLNIQNISNINMLFNIIEDNITFKIDVTTINSFSITLVNPQQQKIGNNLIDPVPLIDTYSSDQYINFYGLISNFTGNKMINYKLKYKYSDTFYFYIEGYNGNGVQDVNLSINNNVLTIEHHNVLQTITSQILIFNADNYNITTQNNYFKFTKKQNN